MGKLSRNIFVNLSLNTLSASSWSRANEGAAPRLYKCDYDSRVHYLPEFRHDQLVFIDQAPLTTTTASTTDALETLNCNKLLPRYYELYQILSVLLYTLTIDENGIYDTVSIHRSRAASCLSSAVRRKPVNQAAKTFSTKPKSVPAENAVGRIVAHRGKDQHLKSLVRWHGYGPEYDTVEPPHHISQHVIHRYRKRGANRDLVPTASQ